MSEKTYQIGKQILKEHDLNFTVEYDGEVFTMKYPTPIEKAAIEADIVRKLGGASRESHSPQHVATVEMYCYVDGIVIPDKSPAWFKGVWTCLDEVLIVRLYEGYLSFRDAFRGKLQAGEFTGSK